MAAVATADGTADSSAAELQLTRWLEWVLVTAGFEDPDEVKAFGLTPG